MTDKNKKKPLKCLLITGAAGRIGRVCRERLSHLADEIRLVDRVDLGSAAAHEKVFLCALSDAEKMREIVDGCDGIVHMGGRPNEGPWNSVRDANIDGVFYLYEAARKSSTKPRIFFASSNHVTGYYEIDEPVDPTSEIRPDSLYGVSKVFGEALASMYHDKFGIESALVRIGACMKEPVNERSLANWLSHDDLIRMIEHIFTVDKLGCPVLYGMSANPDSWWSNKTSKLKGWEPQDNPEPYRTLLQGKIGPPNPNSVDHLQGGMFCAEPIFEDTE